MAGFQSEGPAQHIRVYMPDRDTGKLLLPVMGPEGNAFPEDSERPATRAYTVRQWDPGTQELDIDVALHDFGLGPVWAAGLKKGDPAVIIGPPKRTYFPAMDVDWYLIGGDESALPAIGTLLETLPDHIRAYVLAEVRDADEELPLESAAELYLKWLHRRGGDMPGRALAAAMREAELPVGKGFVWVACETGIMRELRRHFIEERGLDSSVLRTQGYWKAGAADYHDKGEDP